MFPDQILDVFLMGFTCPERKQSASMVRETLVQDNIRWHCWVQSAAGIRECKDYSDKIIIYSFLIILKINANFMLSIVSILPNIAKQGTTDLPLRKNLLSNIDDTLF